MITVVGLGPGDPDLISRRGWELLTSGAKVMLRTEKHPVAGALRKVDVKFTTFDHLYEAGADFSQVYTRIVEELLGHKGTIIYAVPGNPFVAESSVLKLQREASAMGVDVEVVPAMSSLEAVYAELSIDPCNGLAVVDALDPSMIINPRLGLLIVQVFNRLVAGDLKLRLLDVYPPEHNVYVVRAAGTKDAATRRVALSELDHQEFSYADTVYIPPCNEARHVGLAIEGLRDIMVRLRGEDGCPWDQEQTHESLRPYLVEETYEVLEALDEGNMDKLADELGDLMLQVVFHAQIASENQEFDLFDSIMHINKKLKRRHPHVFGTVQVDSADEVVANWQRIKAEERANKPEALLDSIPRGLPALQFAYKLQHKATQVGFDWPTIDGAWQKVEEELKELREAVTLGEKDNVAKELGDVLFSVVNVSRFLGVEPETALRDASGKFKQRFAVVETLARQRSINMEECSLEELDKLWDEAKARGL